MTTAPAPGSHSPASVAIRRRGWRLQFSLRALFLLIAAAAIPLGMMVNRAHRQRAAVRALRRAGAIVRYEHERQVLTEFGFVAETTSQPGPAWLRDFLGIDYLSSVHSVGFQHLPVVVDAHLMGELGTLTRLEELDLRKCLFESDDLRCLRSLHNLRHLNFSFTTADDAALEILAGMPALETLDLSETLVRSDFAAPLENCKSLRMLSVSLCPIESGFFRHLSKCTSLERLDLLHTNCTDESFQLLAPLTRLRRLEISGDGLTDACCETLIGMKALESLTLPWSCVTGRGFARLSHLKALKNLNVFHSLVDDNGLAEIRRLPALESLDIRGNPATLAGMLVLAEHETLTTIDLTIPKTVANADDFGRRFAEHAKRPAPALGRSVPGASAWLNIETPARQPYTAAELERVRVGLQSCPADVRRAAFIVLSDEIEAMDLQSIPLSPLARTIWQECLREVGESTNRRIDHLSKTRSAESPERPAYFEMLADLAQRDPGAARRTAAVESDPAPLNWTELWDSVKPAHQQRVADAWRESDPDNAAACYCTGVDEVCWRDAERVLPGLRAGNQRPELRFRPAPPRIDAKMFGLAVAKLKELGIAVEQSVDWYRHDLTDAWRAPWKEAEDSFARLGIVAWEFARDGKSSEALECCALAETMLRKFLLAPPRELKSVSVGCKLLVEWTNMQVKVEWTSMHEKSDGASDDEFQRLIARNAAAKLLDANIRAILKEARKNGLCTNASVAGWMRGLDDCRDETAAKINRALDDWDEKDRRLTDMQSENSIR